MAAKLYALYVIGVLLSAIMAGVGIGLSLVNGDWRWLLAVLPFAFLFSQLLNPRG